MTAKRDPVAIDAEFLAVGLEPLAPFTTAGNERLCRCATCGTDRWVKLRTLRNGGIACRWCHGWEKWTSWATRVKASPWKPLLGTVEESLGRLQRENLAPLTSVGDLYQPVGVVCLVCGETTVTIPKRLNPKHPGWFGCERCSLDRKHAALANAEELFAANGLRLLAPCRGEYVPQRAQCMTCGVERLVSYDDLRTGSAPLCWTCTHGIRPDEPHRVYLFHPALKVMKIGLTHNRHDRRLLDHALSGGTVIDTVVVPNRESARRLERVLKVRYSRWATDDVGAAEFPQGGWTETWREDAPIPDLKAEARAAFVESFD